ncbi:glycosyltransferase family 4 protein [Streptomyces cacaoi]
MPRLPWQPTASAPRRGRHPLSGHRPNPLSGPRQDPLSGRDPAGAGAKIVFLLHNAYAVGGTVRTTLNLASAFADAGHTVEVVSLNRHRAGTRFAWDPRVRLVPLVDLRDGAADRELPAFGRPARDFPRADRRHAQYTALHDARLRGYLEDSDADVVIGTRPGLNVCLARFGPRGALRLAQEHLRLEAHSAWLRAVLARHYRTLDAVVTTTEADAAVYRRRMWLPGVPVLAVPNIVPAPDPSLLHPGRETAADGAARAGDGGGGEGGSEGGDGDAPYIAAAGRLVHGKRFDLLVEAFARLAPHHPEWQLRIYGGGPEKDRLRERIAAHGLTGRVRLMGTRSPMEAEFARAEVVASASDAESFGMTLVEAMRCGVPVVSTDCPLGPAEIVHDGVDGFLVPKGDADALAGALTRLIEHPRRRRAMGRAALASARRYDPDRIVARYGELFARLRRTRGVRALYRSLSAAPVRLCRARPVVRPRLLRLAGRAVHTVRARVPARVRHRARARVPARLRPYVRAGLRALHTANTAPDGGTSADDAEPRGEQSAPGREPRTAGPGPHAERGRGAHLPRERSA